MIPLCLIKSGAELQILADAEGGYKTRPLEPTNCGLDQSPAAGSLLPSPISAFAILSVQYRIAATTR